MTVHDEIVIECPRIEEKVVIQPAITIMEDLDSYFVPITVDAEVMQRRWSQKAKAKDLGFSFV
jgi:DNA polymerase I-like protein with 3'-5' exonuclease and polymerase domains